jgi:hypothetical protein
MRFIDLTGQRFGRLEVIERTVDPSKPRRTLWRCHCDCGAEVVIDGGLLREGRSRSCGCYSREWRASGMPHHIHGKTRTKEYVAWQNMKVRCTDPRSPKYRLYGARGIRVCDEWMTSFAAFFADVGLAPSPRHTLDRINVDGHYEPGNVRWATWSEQRRNQRREQ